MEEKPLHDTLDGIARREEKPLRDTFDLITRVERIDGETIEVEGIKDGATTTRQLTKHDPPFGYHTFSDESFDLQERKLRARMEQEADDQGEGG